MFSTAEIGTWIAIQRKVNAWLDMIERLAPNTSAPLPDFSDCFL
jgi:hypothetical protein